MQQLKDPAITVMHDHLLEEGMLPSQQTEKVLSHYQLDKVVYVW